MVIEHLFVLMIVLFASVIAISLAVTHHYIKSIYKGINYLAAGVACHIFGFILYTGTLSNIDWIVFFLGNGTFIMGTLLVYKGLNLFVDINRGYKRAYIVLSIGALLGVIFFFFGPSVAYRQNLVSIIITYLVIEIFYNLLHASDKIKSVLAAPIYIFSTAFDVLMIGRSIIINSNLTYEFLPGQALTYNIVSNIIGGILFVVLGFMLSIVINIRAISDLKTERQQMEKISLTDYLTGLPNRLGLEKYISNLRNKENQFAVIFTDFDEFKKVNDQYGHIVGDSVIKAFSEALLSINDDHMFTARYGGDEFVTIFRRFESEAQLKEAIEQKIKTIGSNIIIDNYKFDLTLSVGVALYPRDGNDIYKLIAKADNALGKIKVNGKNNIQFYQ
ncbi:MAG: GGDEF domain-containing protein [Acholeplasma sp.]